jgi:hypothetical protein
MAGVATALTYIRAALEHRGLFQMLTAHGNTALQRVFAKFRHSRIWDGY